MPIEILMPALSPTMEKGNLAKWLKAEGEKVKPGDILAEIETDKATMEVEAIDEGVLTKILVPAGTQDVPVNQLIAVLTGEGETVADAGPKLAAAPKPSPLAEEGGSRSKPGDGAKSALAAPAIIAHDASPEVPAGAEMVKMTMREALRDAMAEEMRRDENVFVIGEEVAEYQGARRVFMVLKSKTDAYSWMLHPD